MFESVVAAYMLAAFVSGLVLILVGYCCLLMVFSDWLWGRTTPKGRAEFVNWYRKEHPSKRTREDV